MDFVPIFFGFYFKIIAITAVVGRFGWRFGGKIILSMVVGNKDKEKTGTGRFFYEGKTL